MKSKILLLFLVFACSIVNAQDTIRSLIITEVNLHNASNAFLEISNVGDKPVQLNQFKIGVITPFTTPWNAYPYAQFMLPERILQPGESLVLTSAIDFGPEQFAKGLDGYSENETKPGMWEIADILVHLPEPNGDSTDSITPDMWGAFNEMWWGRAGFFIEQHLGETDSVVVDQVNCMFDSPTGTNLNFGDDNGGYDVAGFPRASQVAFLVRRFNVKQGNTDFANARGVGLDDSEWIPIPKPYFGGPWRVPLWSVGNHGDYNLDENTLESDVIDVDFANKVLRVPWGIRRGDDIMNYFTKKPGIGWVYNVSPVAEDSLTFAAKTGDKLSVYVSGNDLDLATFDIVVSEPKASDKIVVPMSNQDPTGNWRMDIEQGVLTWPRVTQNESGIDTIWGARGGIPYATRIDSLLEVLEKPSNAEWEIIFKDGVWKPDLKNGDKLKVTAADGSVKEYFISVLDIRPNHNAYLASITWPDIPEFYKGIFGWIGDTIPNFNSTTYNYRVNVPSDTQGIPALVAKTSDFNAIVEVKRAANLTGTQNDRTITFKVTAEDGTTVNQYNIELVKEKSNENTQPYYAEPFISEIIFKDQWDVNCFGEISNPGNQVLDLSNYMIVEDWSGNAADAIRNTNETNWLNRYQKYIPGYKWQIEEDWLVQPYIAESDIAVNALVQPGDVFCWGVINADWATNEPGYSWPPLTQLDVQFNNDGKWKNPWNEAVNKESGTPIGNWYAANIYVFKILNDSIRKGLKPATDPYDFELIEAFGMGDGNVWTIGGVVGDIPQNYMRKPQYYKGNPELKASFGTTPEDAEWTWTNMASWDKLNVGWPWNILNVNNDLGKHFVNTPTHYMSTVGSVLYKVSEGYSMNEQIKGMVTGTTVADFLNNINKANENQGLVVKSVADGSALEPDAVISLNDTLVVTSADSTNVSKYVLDVTDNGLNSDAVLISSKYTITIISQPKSNLSSEAGIGTISGFDYGTALKTIIANIQKPVGSSMVMIDDKGAYVPLTVLNYDTTYVTVTVNHKTYFEVTAEDGITKIVYQLIPQVSLSDAFITSVAYDVIQKDLLIQYVPRGTTAKAFISNLIPSYGAILKLIDKMGFERMDGNIADDDKIIVTSANGQFQNVYHIGMLATQFVPDVTYLAYILSNVYNIDQVSYIISDVSGSAPISEFYTNIKPSAGANAIVVDKNGTEKTTGDINGTDMVKVTSADGKIVVMYKFGQLTGINPAKTNQVEIYPNPTNGKLNVSGVEKGQRIQVLNSVGSTVLDINVESNREIVSLTGKPSGMYLIVIRDKDKILGKYKAIKY